MKTKLLLITALLVVAGSVSAWLYWPRANSDFTGLSSRTVIEMEPDSTIEWIEIQKINSDGNKVEAEVLYRNGETGNRYWRNDQSLAKEIIRFKDGRQRMYAEFAADGKQIVTGKEIRVDGTTLWEAVVDAKRVVTTTAYWYNGKVFEVERRTVDKPMVDQWFYYTSGNQWQHFIGIHDGLSLPQLEEIWHEDGTRQFVHYSGMNEASFDSIFRADGTLKLKQYWIMRSKDWYPEGTPVAQRRLFLKTELYSDDGQRIVREFMQDPGDYVIGRVVDRHPDGSIVQYELLYDGSVYLVTTVDSHGKTVEEKRLNARTTFKITMDPEYRENYVDTLEPKKAWRELEDHPEKRLMP